MIYTEKECAQLALAHKETPWVPVKQFQDRCVPSAIGEGPREMGIHTDWLGLTWLMTPDQPGATIYDTGHPVIDDIEKWEDQLRIPDLDAVDWAGCAEKDTAGWDRKNRMTHCTIINGMFESLHMFCGFEDALCYLITDEDAVSAFMDAIADYKIALIERVHKYYKPDKIQLHDDYGSQSNLFMRRELWQRLVKPKLKRIVDAVHGMGMYFELHSCGMVKDLFEDFVELGIDCTNPVMGINDPPALKKKYGDRITIVGGFDRQPLDNPTSSEEEIKAGLWNTLTSMAPGGSWIPDMSFLDPGKNHLWFDMINEWNRPLYEKLGIPPRYVK